MRTDRKSAKYEVVAGSHGKPADLEKKKARSCRQSRIVIATAVSGMTRVSFAMTYRATLIPSFARPTMEDDVVLNWEEYSALESLHDEKNAS